MEKLFFLRNDFTIETEHIFEISVAVLAKSSYRRTLETTLQAAG